MALADDSTKTSQDGSSQTSREPDKQSAIVVESATSSEDPTADEYPHGLRLVILVLAVNLALFLASLDQVSDGSLSTALFNY